MFRTFSLTVLITYILLAIACKSAYVTSVGYQNTAVDEQINTIDSNLVSIYLPYKNKLDSDMNRVISVCENDMVKNKPESGLTNLLADLLLEEGKAEAKNQAMQIDPEISFFNYGGIRTGLQKGNITVGKAFELMPFENEMVLIQLTGVQLQQFYDLVAESGGGSVGGARFVISGGKSKNIVVSGKPLQPENKYWMVTNDYAANGGDDLSVLRQRLDFKSTGVKMRDVIIRNFEKRQKAGIALKVNLDGRISNE
jgi:2',3'-cyclic-nucleotide 2'-phosphodiesterase (5'-nucleotidase family)